MTNLDELKKKHQELREQIIAKYGDCIPFVNRPEMAALDELAKQIVDIVIYHKAG